MKKIIITFLSLSLISCNPFDEDKVLKYKDDLNNLVSKFEKYNDGTYDRDEFDEFIIDDLDRLDINSVVKNNTKKNLSYSGFFEENDSIIIFINKSTNLFDREKRIIYDFHKTPKNFGNKTIFGASYRIKQLDDRWYYSEEGFD
ncbi:hypothetical protein [Flavobacterium seoulense]|uniref:Lipoprotein n=1 Tax=Flavobacterium seoulense TaxID=1492738 RepID=A0A066WWD3_9FLAO|nr:hypothetical protein [Flavobacterium seoulense]KDN54975.1 hypothetical protein FEM21_19800 [Flavobacterium seoulense]